MTPRNRTLLIIGTVAALVLIAAGIAAVATGGDDSDDAGSSPGGVVTTLDPSVELEQTRPVEGSGQALPTFDREATDDPGVGLAAPVVEGQSFDGSPITLGGASDGPTLLVFLAHWCPVCNAEVPELVELYESGGVPDGVDVVGISTAVAADRPNYPPSEWLAGEGWPWPTMADDPASSAFLGFGGSSFPFFVLLDADGAVLSRQSGERSSEEVEAWINAALGSSAT